MSTHNSKYSPILLQRSQILLMWTHILQLYENITDLVVCLIITYWLCCRFRSCGLSFGCRATLWMSPWNTQNAVEHVLSIPKICSPVWPTVYSTWFRYVGKNTDHMFCMLCHCNTVQHYVSTNENNESPEGKSKPAVVGALWLWP